MFFGVFFFFFFSIASHSDKNMMGLQNLCTLFGPTLMKLSPKDNLHVDDMNREIRESMQQAQALFYILQLHAEQRLSNDPYDTYEETRASRSTDNHTESVGESTRLDALLSQVSLTNSHVEDVDSNNNSVVRGTPSGSKERDEPCRRPHMQTAL
jgi:hypothetical protein